jgi:ComEC/Rec2-related protein
MRLWRLRFRQTTLLFYLCVSILAGLGLARVFHYSAILIPLLLCSVAAFIFRKRNIVALVMLCLAGLSLGLARGSVYMKHVASYNALYRKPITLRAIADTDAVYGNQTQLSFDATNIEVIATKSQKLTGKIKVEGFGAPMVFKGDKLELTGKMTPTKGAAQARMSYATFRVIGSSNSPLDSVRRRFVAALASTLPEPQASFGAGLLIGQRSTLPKETSDQLAIVGLTHIVAVSGYNLTIIIDAMRRLMGKRSKYQTTIFSLGLMLLFIALTGLSASIVRAALVSSLSLLAWYYGRTFRPLLLIVLAAAITALWSPFYVWSDVGWYLSFLAFFGILVVAPKIIVLFSKKDQPKILLAVLAETFAAQLMTIPIIMYIFGRFSLIGLFANLLIVPLVPVAMLLTVVAGLAGMIMPLISGWFAWTAKIILTYMLDMTVLMSRVPHASIKRATTLKQMLGMYAIIICLTLILGFKRKTKKAIITDETRRF